MDKNVRKQRMIEAKRTIESQTAKLKRYENTPFEWDLKLREDETNKYFHKCIVCPHLFSLILGDLITFRRYLPTVKNLTNMTRDLRPVANLLVSNGDGDTKRVSWNKANIFDGCKASGSNINDDRKEDATKVEYEIEAYKGSDLIANIDGGTENLYHIQNIPPHFSCAAKVRYTVNGIFQAPYSPFKCNRYTALWSSKYKASGISIQRANHAVANYGGAVRAHSALLKGATLSVVFQFKAQRLDQGNGYDMVGVICSDYQGSFGTNEVRSNAYGMCLNGSDSHYHGANGRKAAGFKYSFKAETIYAISMHIDAAQTRLRFSMGNKFRGDISLPRIPANQCWYPCAALEHNGAECGLKLKLKAHQAVLS